MHSTQTLTTTIPSENDSVSHHKTLFQHRQLINQAVKYNFLQGVGSNLGTVGTITFKPLEGRFNGDKETMEKIDPYCKFKVGFRSAKSSAARGEGSQQTWVGEAVSMHVKSQEFAKIKIKNHNKAGFDNLIGTAKIPLGNVYQLGKIVEWVPIQKNDVLVGEVLLELEFVPDVKK